MYVCSLYLQSLFDEQKQKLVIRRDIQFDKNDFGKEKVISCDPVPTTVQQNFSLNQEQVERHN